MKGTRHKSAPSASPVRAVLSSIFKTVHALMHVLRVGAGELGGFLRVREGPRREGTAGPLVGPGFGPGTGPALQMTTAHEVSGNPSSVWDLKAVHCRRLNQRRRGSCPLEIHARSIGQGRATPPWGEALTQRLPAPGRPAGSLSPGPYTSTVTFPFTDACETPRRWSWCDQSRGRRPGHWSARRHARSATCRATAPPAR